MDSLRWYTFLTGALLSIAFALLLAACGAQTGTSASGGSPAATSPAATSAGPGTAYGCPNAAVVNTAPARANVIINATSPNEAQGHTAHVGDVIEVRLPFGSAWHGPASSPAELALLQPAGYAWTAANACIWRFAAKQTGTGTLEFSRQAICKRGAMCPMSIMILPITISVQ